MMPWVTWVLVTGVTALGSMSLAVLVYTITGVTELTGVIRVTGASGVRVTWVAWVWVNMVTNLIILKLSKNKKSMHSFLCALTVCEKFGAHFELPDSHMSYRDISCLHVVTVATA